MFTAYPSIAAGWDLERVVVHLSAHPNVHGLLAIGSTASGEDGPHSDIDLVVVVDDACDDLRLALTTIDGRLADVLFVTDRQLASWPIATGQRAWDPTQLRRWWRGGRILYDPDRRLSAAQELARSSLAEDEYGPAARYGIWFSVNYNLTQNQRLARSDDPIYAAALDVRLLYALTEIWQGYFVLRDLPLRGEKAQIRYLQNADPGFLSGFQACLEEKDRSARLRCCAELAQLALAPVGPVWAADATGILPWPSAEGDDRAHTAAVAAWADLFSQGPG